MTGVDKYLLKNGDGAKGKDIDAKRRIVAQLAAGEKPIADIAKALEISIPTITKLIGELTAEGIVEDLGKVETAGGRRPNIFGLKSTDINFLGAEITNDTITLVAIDLQGRVVASEMTKHKGDFMGKISEFALARNAVAAGICVEGRVNPFTGQAHSDLDDTEKPLVRKIEEHLGIPVYLDSSVRARCCIEYRNQNPESVKDMLYVDLGRTIGIAIVANGALYYGHSGLAGELYNAPAMEGDIGRIVDAAHRDDPHAIEFIESVAERTGRDIAMMLNLLNPEAVVVGGVLARAGDYLMLPLQAAIHKHTPKILYRDTRFRLATPDENDGATGAATIIRNKTLGLL